MDGLLSERYAEQLDGMLSCYDRIVITGSLMPICYAQGMTRYLYQHQIRIFDYAKFAEPLRACVRENAEALAKANGVQIEYLRKKGERKEKRVRVEGLIHLIHSPEETDYGTGEALA